MSARDRQVGGDHYKNMGVEPWDVIGTWPQAQQIGFYRGNALKYLMRAGSKDDPLQEIKKARHYLDRLIELLGERNDSRIAEAGRMAQGSRQVYADVARGKQDEPGCLGVVRPIQAEQDFARHTEFGPQRAT
jgi:hypothetical protein